MLDFFQEEIGTAQVKEFICDYGYRVITKKERKGDEVTNNNIVSTVHSYQVHTVRQRPPNPTPRREVSPLPVGLTPLASYGSEVRGVADLGLSRHSTLDFWTGLLDFQTGLLDFWTGLLGFSGFLRSL